MGLNSKQIELLERFELPSDFTALSDDQFYAIDDAISKEMMIHGVNDAGNGLNEYGELCRSILVDLPDD